LLGRRLRDLLISDLRLRFWFVINHCSASILNWSPREV
jgi:hypothetical protein